MFTYLDQTFTTYNHMKFQEIDGQKVIFVSSEHMDLVPDESVDFFVTSPPYWHLKDYGDERQIGQSSYEHYLERMNAVWKEWGVAPMALP